MASLLTIEVAYARPDVQQIVTVQVPADCDIQQAIEMSGILTLFPEIDLAKQKVGVFSKMKHLADPVADGDRIEIYRPLLIDPKEARRLKAERARVKK